MRFSDKTDPGDEIQWLPHPNSVIAQVLEVRISQNERWQKSSGNVLLKFPDKKTSSSKRGVSLNPLNYGDTAFLQGAFITPDEPLFKGDFDYKLYLKTRGISKIYYVSSLRRDNLPPPLTIRLMQHILSFRNMVLLRMTDGMTIANRKILAALMFGCRYGLNYESRRTFLESGVIHIFAISGLHVGMLALAIFLLLRWLPFRLRYLLVPFLLLVYVITTGMHASAMRALLMISVWSFMKAFLYKTSPLNIVFLAASTLLFLNPISIFGAGFQFSFVIAGFLVLAWKSVNEWLLLMNERSLWIPNNCMKLRDHIMIRLKNLSFNSFATSSIAWLSGSAILLIHRSLFIPGAVFTNFIIIPFVWILFVLAVLDLLLQPFYLFFSLNPVLEIFINIIKSISAAGADLGGRMNLISPPWYLILIFFAALLLLLTARRKSLFFGAGITIIFVLTSLFMGRKFQKEEIIVFHGGESQEPAVVMLPSGGGVGVTVLNPGPDRRVKSILSYLARSGVNVVDYLVFSENRKSCCEAAWLLLSGIEVRHIIFPPDFKRSRYAKFAMKKALQSGGYISISDKISSDRFISCYRNPSFEFLRSSNSDYYLSLKTGEWSVDLTRRYIMPGEKIIQINTPETNRAFDLINASKLCLYDN